MKSRPAWSVLEAHQFEAHGKCKGEDDDKEHVKIHMLDLEFPKF